MTGQREVNRELWSQLGAELVEEYQRHPLRQVEEVLLERYAGELSGPVLEVGVGAGRLTERLVARSREVTGIDVAPAMIERCRRRFPQAAFHELDLADLSLFGDGSFAVLLAGYNVIDVLDDAQRGAALDEWRRVLQPGGLLALSSHNLHHADRIPAPGRVLARHPRQLVRNLLRRRRRIANRERLAPLERREGAWAILNDEAHDFALLHYYATRDETERRLAQHGFALIECLDLDGAAVAPGDAAAACPELHYVARRSA